LISLVPPHSTKNLLERATEVYRSQLPGSPGEFHLSGRGITIETMQKFRLGYVADPLLGDEYYIGRISIPYLTASGVVSVRYRTAAEAKPKYLSSPGDVGRPFNVLALGSNNKVYVTEGEMDAITLDQMGLTAIGIPGATQWQRVYGRILRFRTVVVLADGDQAGRDFADAISRDIRVKVIHMPDGEDVNSVYCSMGEEKFLEWITE